VSVSRASAARLPSIARRVGSDARSVLILRVESAQQIAMIGVRIAAPLCRDDDACRASGLELPGSL
jgi:hypothetical protein